ncbi:RWD domain-containing protein 3 [Bombina bombina]|uniref:RWD domain-containing protein 3 n=1 Tax=Bombina bombina TaxID=8345 RepID=UPI00235AE70E|nr:RWD domain-containing protein 3 [Bombina bombina]
MSEAALDEISALSAIYCAQGECEVLSHSDNGITAAIQTSLQGVKDSEIHLRLLFELPVTYPSCLPNISVSSKELTRTQCSILKDKLLEQAKQHILEPMIHNLILWLQQNLKYLIKETETSVLEENRPLTDEGTWTVLLHLDHMRAKNKYVKTVEKWATDLKLCGRLMFMGKIILILLQGEKSRIREYLVLQKTCKVDVDSSGRKCKEKMLSVLSEARLPSEHKRFHSFEVQEYSSVGELKKEFEDVGLGTVFTEFVQSLF